MSVGFPIPNAIQVLSQIQVDYAYLNQVGTRIFMNNPGPSDPSYSDILNLANGIGNYPSFGSISQVCANLISNIQIFLHYLPIGITGITVSGTTATATTGNSNGTLNHNFSSGDKVIISNSSVSALNTPANTLTTITSTTSTTFSYTVASGTANDTGSTASAQCYTHPVSLS